MAKTIKEMAEDKYSIYEDAWMHKAYIEGANVVLDELKTRLKEYKTNSLGEYFVAWDYINEIINELKGE